MSVSFSAGRLNFPGADVFASGLDTGMGAQGIEIVDVR